MGAEILRGLFKVPGNPPAERILLTGSLGDVFAVESLWTEEHREKLTTIYYATRQYKVVKEALSLLPNLPKLQHIDLWHNPPDIFGYISKSHLLSTLQRDGLPLPEEPDKIVDWSVVPVFAKFNLGVIQYQSSSFVRFPLASTTRFSLPSRYITVCPTTVHDFGCGRNFVQEDWNELFSILSNKRLKAVALGVGPAELPKDDRIINLYDQTSIGEALEILKSSCGYMGVDSSLAVIAAKIFGPSDLKIKSVNEHCVSNAHIYYAPRSGTDFIKKGIK